MTKLMALSGVAVAVAVAAFAQTEGSRGEAKATVAGKAVSIEYGRPSLKGRDMLAQAKVGEAWRMGAGPATTLKTEGDLRFGAVAVPRGEYVLTATRLDADHWQLNVLSATDRTKLAEVPLRTQALSRSVEQFTIDLSGSGSTGELKLSWGATSLSAAFTGR
jgi:hypothetical protein